MSKLNSDELECIANAAKGKQSDEVDALNLDELERIARAATGGPWKVCQESSDEVLLEHGGFPRSGYSHWSMLRKRDAIHVATFAPPAALALIAEVRRLQVANTVGLHVEALSWLYTAQTERDHAMQRVKELEGVLANRLGITVAATEYQDRKMGEFGISEHDWIDFLENADFKSFLSEEDPKNICSCGCQACQGTGWYQQGRSYKQCCIPCSIHHDNK